MSDWRLDPIILGHNPFFGVDHLSQDRGNEKSRRFEDTSRIVDMLLYCHDLGVRGMMMSTHPRATALCEAIQRQPTLADEWRIYPLVPYIQKYIRGANEKGMVNLFLDTFSQANLGQKLSLLLRGGKGILSKDLGQMLHLLGDIELLPFHGLRLGAVFLHDVPTDLALGLGLDSVLENFRDHVHDKYGVPVGFATKNLPLLLERLERRGWAQPLVMASFNAVGFCVNPSLDKCAEILGRPGVAFVAMNTLASGYLSPEEAYSYIARFRSVRSVVVGISRKEHAAKTVDAIRRHLPFANTISVLERFDSNT